MTAIAQEIPQNATEPASPQREDFDLIVIGAGLGALAAGAIAARRGKRVLVVEKHTVLGGYASVFGRKGTTFDVSLHQIGGVHKTRVRGILEDAGIHDKLEFVKDRALSELQLEPGEALLRIPNGDMMGFRRTLMEMFPDEKPAIRRWFWFMRRYGRQIRYWDNIRNRNPLVQGVTIFFAPILAPVVVASIMKMPRLSLALRVRDPNLRKILLHFSGYYGAPANEINMLFPMVSNYSYHADGGCYLKGGGFAITRQLALVIRRAGGTILTGREVDEITTEDNRVTGVRLRDDPVFYTAPEIVCGANPFTVYGKLLADHKLARREKARIEKLEVGMTASVLYLKIGVKPEELNRDLADVYEYMRPPEEPEAEYYRRFRDRQGFDETYDKDGINLTVHSRLDPGGLGDGKGATLDLFYCDNYDRWATLGDNAYQEQKKIETEKMLDELEKVLPGLRDHIEIVELATPLTMERFTSNAKGAIYGFSQNVSQAARHRFPIRSPIRGLAFVSAWSNPGGGYEGVLRVADAYSNPVGWKGRGVFLGLIAVSVIASQLLH